MGLFWNKKEKTKIENTVSSRSGVDRKFGVEVIDPCGNIQTEATPIVESIHKMIAQSFARLDFKMIKEVKGDNGQEIIDVMVDSPLTKIFQIRANSRMSPFDFKETMIYQLLKYGNAMAYIERDKKGNVLSLIPLNMAEYKLGESYELLDGQLVLHCKHQTNVTNPFSHEKKTVLEDEYLNYNDLIHIRINGNNIFYNEEPQFMDGYSTLVKVIDNQLNSIIKDLSQNGKIKGVITQGFNGYATTDESMTNQEAKLKKQEELEQRLENQNTFLVLDSGENFTELKTSFSHLNGEQFKNVKELLFDLYGINEDILNLKASSSEMELFFVTKVQPLVEKFVEEVNYKCVSPKARSQGYKFAFTRNIFEFLPTDKAIDCVYKGQHDLTKNEVRHDVYHKPAMAGGDVLLDNLNFGVQSQTPTEINDEKGGESE